MITKGILLVGNYYPSKGGISALIRNLAKGLSSDGYKVEIYSLSHGNIFKRIIKYLKLLFVIRRFEIIHAHGCSNLGQIPIIASYVLSVILRKRFVITFHGSIDNSSIVANNLFFRKLMSRKVIITTPSVITSKSFSDVGYQTVYIPNIVENDSWDFRKRDSISPKMICTRSKYNPKLVIDTFIGVKKQYPDATLIMLGEFLDEKIQEYASQFESIFIVGNVPRKEVYRFLNMSDIYINSCSNDSFGYSIYEALSVGLAVVSIESPSLRDSVGEEIIEFSFNTETLESAVFNVLKNQSTTIQRIEKGYELYAMFTWNMLKKFWLDVYKIG
jgi:glycosyltransferase involved in cell wall biosynthesis